jgi:hypothetical protein
MSGGPIIKVFPYRSIRAFAFDATPIVLMLWRRHEERSPIRGSITSSPEKRGPKNQKICLLFRQETIIGAQESTNVGKCILLGGEGAAVSHPTSHRHSRSMPLDAARSPLTLRVGEFNCRA